MNLLGLDLIICNITRFGRGKAIGNRYQERQNKADLFFDGGRTLLH